MDLDFTIFIVDDSAFDRTLLASALREICRIESFAKAEDCLARLGKTACLPDLFLLDVDMPGMDGYSLCRQIKKLQVLQNIPVIFASGLDDLESRMEGFDAGGFDFMVKPINLRELTQKVRTVRYLIAEQQLTSSKLIESETLTALILSNLDEYAVLIKFLRSLNECDTPSVLIDRFFDLLRAYHLHSAIQIRLPALEITRSDRGGACPLELDIINHLRSMDRIFEFRTRAAYNFEHITVLIQDMPLHDPELCGRIRDTLAIAAESANAKIQAMQTKTENARARDGVTELLKTLKTTIENFEQKYALARYRGSSLTMDMLNQLASAFAFLGMSDEQEKQILGIVQGKSENLAEIYNFSGETQKALKEMAERLACILQPTAKVCDQRPEIHSPDSAHAKAAISIF